MILVVMSLILDATLVVVVLFVALSLYARTSTLQRRVLALEKQLRASSMLPRQQTVSPEQSPALLPSASQSPPASAPEGVALPPTPDRTASDAPAGDSPSPEPQPAPTASVEPAVLVGRPWTFERIAVLLAAAGGAGAVVLAGLYFFALAFQEGWVSPGTRYMLGLVSGVLMVLSAELLWSRRYRGPAAGLSGAGLGVLYGALYSGSVLYELIPNSATFVLMALVTLTVTGLSNRHQSLFLAVLAALGGFMTPVLLSTGNNQAVALFVYLALLDAGLVFTAVRQGWLSLSLLAALMTVLFQVGWGIQYRAQDQVLVALAGASGLGGLFLLATLRASPGSRMAWGLLSGGLASLILGPLLFLGPFDGAGPQVALLLGLWLLLASTAVLSLTLLRGWVEGSVAVVLSLLIAQMVYVSSWAAPDGMSWLLPLAVLAVPVGLCLLGTLRVSAVPLLAAYVSAVLCALLVAASGQLSLETSSSSWPLIGFTVTFVSLGLLSALRKATGPVMLVALLYAAIMFSGLAWTMPETAFLLLIAGLIWLFFAGLPFSLAVFQQPLDDFKWSVAAVSGVALFLPLYLSWRDTLGVLLLGGLPLMLSVASIAGVAWLRLKDRAEDGLPMALYTGSALLLLSMVLPLQIEHEWLIIGWSLEVAALAWLSGYLRHPLIPVTAGILAAIVSALLYTPSTLSLHGSDGLYLLNWILYTWGVPALALLYAAFPFRHRRPRLSAGLLLAGVLHLFSLLNLEVAHAFSSGGELSFRSEDLFEEMVRSVSWAAFGIALLVAGMVSSSRMLRIMAFCFLLLSAGKVFLVDLWSLSGLARVGSIMGLGVFLLFAALLFQRVVLREERPDLEPETGPETGPGPEKS